MNSWGKCTLCELRNECESPIGLPLPINPKVFVIKNHPSKEEELLGVGFSDREGKLCTKLCDKYLAGLYYCTYLIKCPTNKGYIGAKSFKTCGDNWLVKEIQALKPSVVVALGDNVVDKIDKLVERNAELNFKLFPCESLNKALNSRSVMLKLEFQLRKVGEYVKSLGMD